MFAYRIEGNKITQFNSKEKKDSQRSHKPEKGQQVANNSIYKFSGKSKKRLTQITNKFIDSIKFVENHENPTRKAKKRLKTEITFCTLTLSSTQKHDFNYLKRNLLGGFITKLKYYYKDLSFIWKLELQKNGNTHFHILFNRYIFWEKIKILWNDTQKTHGYITEYTEKHKNLSFEQYKEKRISEIKAKNPKFKPSKEQIEKIKKAYEYGKATFWEQPNSTDIHGLKKITNIKNYIVKYIAKKEPAAQIAEITAKERAAASQENRKRTAAAASQENRKRTAANMENKHKRAGFSNNTEHLGRVWGASDNLRLLNFIETRNYLEVSELLEQSKIVVNSDYCIVYSLPKDAFCMAKELKLYALQLCIYETLTENYCKINFLTYNPF